LRVKPFQLKMQVNKLYCKNFRNLTEIEITPCSGMNVICGENAQGKTNLIEAIWLFTGAKSFRNSKDSAFLNLDSQKGVNILSFEDNGTEYTAKMEFSDKRCAFLNEKALKSPSGLAGKFNAIVFSPIDLSLVTEGPSVRRRFLDLAVGQLYPNYISLLRDYNKAVMQRNQSLKEYKYDSSLSIMLDIFEEEIANKGEKIIKTRLRYLDILKNFIPDIYYGISSGREFISAEYLCSSKGDELKQKLLISRKEDMFTCVTSVGPHRDDIDFKINELSARNYGSQGQKRSIALSVKLAQAQVIKQVAGEYPVCLLDDVMSELDPKRQEYILNHIRNWQCFLSCCDPSNFTSLKKGKVFEVIGGSVTER